MAVLENSARKLLRATYAPIKAQAGSHPRSKRAWAKHSFVANLGVTRDELNHLLRRSDPDQRAMIAIEAVVNQKGTASALENVPLFAEVDWDSLVSITEAIVKLREQDLEEFRDTHAAILEAYKKQQENGRAQMSPPVHGFVAPPGLALDERSRAALLQTAVPAAAPGLQTLLEWAVKNGIRATGASSILDHLPRLFAAPALARKEDFEQWAAAKVQQTHNYVVAMKQHLATEPVGLLHLERLNFVPAGIELGELVHSVPLSPGEEVNISHKEWSNTSEEFSKIATDFMEAYSEEGVSEKSELAQTTNSQDQHSSGLNTGVTASGGYGPVSITTSLSYNVADSASHSEQVARNHSSTLTRKASARSKKEHKISFKVASAAGTEDQQVRKIKNPFSDKATRVDYYQLVRKWRVDLFRYGVRLTYDLAIPEPGSGILSRIQEVQATTAALEQGFEFDLTPSQVTREDWIAGKYGQIPNAPPEPEIEWLETRHHEVTGDPGKLGNTFFFTIDFEVPEGYEITSVTEVDKSVWNHAAYVFNYRPDPPQQLVGMSGSVAIMMEMKGIYSFFVQLHIKASLRPEAHAEWQVKAWNALREDALARYEENRQNLKQRLSTLLGELGAQDPLTLRKIEREEVMKGVIRWLFGPSFEFAPAFIPEQFFGSEMIISQKHWGQVFGGAFMSSVLAHGEIIKFLHHAIEWENMLYFLYPYFWSHPDRWELKKYLDHPDPMHRVFLKSGSARVVLTIRPGFEKHFVSFLETGTFEPLPANDTYWKITEEMEAYANTNYPGIRPANPIEGARPLLYPKQEKAWEEMQIIGRLIDGANGYFKTFGAYPSTLNDLQSILPYDEDPNDDAPPITAVPLEDPWGHDYVYTSPGLYSSYGLVSYGADGIAEKDQTDPAKLADVLNADITSWAEASLIGRWYEYTPTSALDIRFGETLPEA